MRIYLDLCQEIHDEPEKYDEYLAKGREITATIERQLEFTRQYEDLGVNSRPSRTLSSCIAEAKAGLDLAGDEREGYREFPGGDLCRSPFGESAL